MQSTIDDSAPATGSTRSSAPVRNNFAAAKADIEALELDLVFATPTTGSTLTASAAGGGYMLDPAATIATLTVVTPPSPRDLQLFEITTTATITALTVNPASGQTVKGGSAFRYRAADSTWRRRW